MNRVPPLALILILLAVPSSSSAQQMTSWGTDFWLAFLPNWHDYDEDTYYIAATAKRNCSVTITSPINGWIRTMMVNAGETATLTFSPPDNTRCWAPGSCITTDKGLHITATDTVQIYAYNHSGTESTSDAALILPTPSLGSDYIIQTYPNVNNDKEDNFICFNVLAIEDNTTIDIVLSGATSTNIVAGTTLTVNLQAGQIYQVNSPLLTGDFSGTTVTERHCKPFAAFAGASGARVPTTNNNSSDHLFYQCRPSYTWGSDFTLIPTFDNNYDYVRVTARRNGCIVRWNGIIQATLNRGQTHEFAISGSGHLTTSSPAMVCQYISSRHSRSGTEWGDCAMFIVTPTTQTNQAVAIPIFPTNSRGSYTSRYYLNTIFPTTSASSMRFNGAPIDTNNIFPVFGYNSYSYARLPLSATNNNTLSGDSFQAYTVGQGENWEAYAFNLGGTDNATYPNTQVLLEQTSDSTCDSTYSWRGNTYTLSGFYYDTISDPDGCDTVFSLNLNILDDVLIDIDTAVCDETFPWDNTELAVPGNYQFDYTTPLGCDSTVKLNLDLLPSYSVNIDTILCEGDTLHHFGLAIPAPGNSDTALTTLFGCDSTIHIHIAAYPTYDTTYYAHIYDTDTYHWFNGLTFNYPVDTFLHFFNRYGCDSLLHLHLEVDTILHDPDIWIPNIFSPTQPGNELFRIGTNNIDQLTVSIYHRWGDLVCTYDGLATSWDGTKNGQPCPEGAYVYLVRYHPIGSRQNTKPIIGTVLLVR